MTRSELKVGVGMYRCTCGIQFGDFDAYHQHCKIYDYEARKRRRVIASLANANPGWR